MGDLHSLISQQQAEYEKCISDLLNAHRREFLEAIRVELGQLSRSPSGGSTDGGGGGGDDRGEASTESFASVGAACEGKSKEPSPALMDGADAGEAGPALSRTSTQESYPVAVNSETPPGSPRCEELESPEASGRDLGAAATGGSSSAAAAAGGPAAARSRYLMRSMQGRTDKVKEVLLQTQTAMVLEQSYSATACLLIQMPAFEYAVCLVVLLNAVSIGVHAQWMMGHIGQLDQEPTLFLVVDLVFAAIFLMELLLRVLGEGPYFLAATNRNLLWNILDTVLVISAIIEELLTLFAVAVPNVSMMRMLRILRMVRVVRIFRVTTFFNDLRLIVMALLCAARSLFWVVVLLLFVMYIFSVFLMEITASTSAGDASSEAEIYSYISSLDVTMYTLYKSVSGGIEWGPVADELAKRGAILTVLYAVYIAFATLCILNVVTGIFVQNTSTIANTDQLEMGLEHLERRRVWLNEVMELFSLGDTERTGQIDWKRFEALLAQPAVQACFLKLGIDVECINPRGLFCLFDGNNDGAIELEEFAHGIMKLHGAARSLDLQLLGNDSRRMLQYLQMLMRRRDGLSKGEADGGGEAA